MLILQTVIFSFRSDSNPDFSSEIHVFLHKIVNIILSTICNILLRMYNLLYILFRNNGVFHARFWCKIRVFQHGYSTFPHSYPLFLWKSTLYRLYTAPYKTVCISPLFFAKNNIEIHRSEGGISGDKRGQQTGG